MSKPRVLPAGSDDDCVVTALGLVTSGAIGRQAAWALLERGERPRELGLREFKAAARFVDRKFLRATSDCDAVALASLATMLESRGGFPTRYDAERVGLYVGASPASAQGNAPYVEAMLASRGGTQGASVRDFGRTCMSARPTTLLVGLPNNVLCYGAMMLEARGPNSNYTVPWLGGFLAILNALRRLRRRSLDLAVAGAYAAYGSDLGRELYRQLASTHDLPDFSKSIADGAAFVSLERRSALPQEASGGFTVLLGGGTASDGLGPLRYDPQGVVFERLTTARPLQRRRRHHGRLRPFLLDIVQDDGGIPDRVRAVDQRRHFAARIGLQQYRIADADMGRLDRERDLLFPQHDLHLLGERRQRRIEQGQRHGRSSPFAKFAERG